MEAEIRGALRLLAWSSAFWAALRLGGARLAAPGQRRRLAAGLLLGAVAARAGFCALHADVLLARPGLLLDVATGYSVLFVPLGLLAAAPWRSGAAARAAYLGAALGALPLALAVARLGCFLAGCCPGLPTDLPWGLRWSPLEPTRHPVALYEVAALCALAAALERVPPPLRPSLALAAPGALRLALGPLRAPSPLGPPVLAPGWIAAAWVGLGLLLASPAARTLVSPAVPRSDPT